MEAGTGEDVGDAAAHGACADYCDCLNLAHLVDADKQASNVVKPAGFVGGLDQLRAEFF